jgi:beta-N-acetylhexosaminidase
LEPQVLRNTILEKYGPDATGQVAPHQITAFTFAQLRNFLQFRSPDLDPYLRDADWIVFAVLDYAPEEQPSSVALKQFLRERAEGLEGKNLVVLAYGAPYYLDTTEVSKLTAYFGVYGKSQPFVEASIRALFLDFGPVGHSPVTVEGVGYDLTTQLSPDPNQTIEVMWADQPAPAEGVPPPPVELDVGDPLRVRTSVILDRNGNLVPDGTPVIFRSFYLQQQLERRVEVVTVDGVAQATITLEVAGELEIRATSDPAISSRSLLVLLGETAKILTPTPTSTPTPTPTPTPTFTPTPTPTWTPTATATPTPTPEPEPPPPPKPRVEWIDFGLALLGMIGAGGVVWMGAHQVRLQDRLPRRLSSVVLWSGVCGLGGYLLYGLALPGTSFLAGVPPGLRGLLIGFGCGLLPLLAVVWLSLQGGKSRG